jgi:hypothetical protein
MGGDNTPKAVLSKRMSDTGPDIPAIQCRTPDGCCGPSPCDLTLDQFICQIRSLLPPGDIYNNTVPYAATPPINRGAITVGCSQVGCEQLIFGGCCDDETIFCTTGEPVAPQLAVVDSYATVAYGSVESLCEMLKELDPCTAKLTLHQWAARLGITAPDPCEPMWSDKVLAILVCLMLQLKNHVMNWSYLMKLAHSFGADMALYFAGDMNCGPTGWWTMARDAPVCDPQPPPCATENDAPSERQEIMRLNPPCQSPPLSLNIVIAPTEITPIQNCNLALTPITLPHDPELYEAWKWLLPRILPQPALYCIYEQNEADCIGIGMPVPYTSPTRTYGLAGVN